MSRIRTVAAVAGIVLAGGLVGACSQGNVFSLEVGDCYNNESDDATEVSDVPVVDCSEPHDNEVFAEFELPDGDTVPSDDVIQQALVDNCLPEFETFIGTAYEDSTLEVVWFQPTADSWEKNDDRLVTCAVTDPAGQTTGTLKGAAR